MNLYIIMLTLIGIAALGMAWMPALSKRTGISYAIWYVLAGFILYTTFDSFPNPDPIRKDSLALHLTELVVIISLMGTGLKIDEPFSFRHWLVPFRLVTITMLVSIAALTYLGVAVLGFDLPSALLLGAVLAPTDPVLASDVQVGPPLDNARNDVRFALTAEAGMNDGMAFPFVWLATTCAAVGLDGSSLQGWLQMDVFYRIIIGVVAGFVIGKILAWMLFYLPENTNFAEVRDGFVAVSATFVVYGTTELLQGYGFIAVFVAAITIRNYELGHHFHTKLHSFADQIERILLAIVLILFGGSLSSGILNALNWPMALVGVGTVFLVRPLAGFLGLIKIKLSFKEKAAISFFGIRGVGSFFYLAFAMAHSKFSFADELWATVSFVVLVSILIHGSTAAFSMAKIEKLYKRQNQRR